MWIIVLPRGLLTVLLQRAALVTIVALASATVGLAQYEPVSVCWKVGGSYPPWCQLGVGGGVGVPGVPLPLPM
jgi:hypothetical protein